MSTKNMIVLVECGGGMGQEKPAERRGGDRAPRPWHPSLVTVFCLPVLGIPFIPPHGKSIGFLQGGGLGCSVPGPPCAPGAQPLSLWLPPQDACRAFTSHLLVYELCFLSVCAFLLSDLWAGSPPASLRLGFGCRDAFSFFSLSSQALF